MVGELIHSMILHAGSLLSIVPIHSLWGGQSTATPHFTYYQQGHLDTILGHMRPNESRALESVVLFGHGWKTTNLFALICLSVDERVLLPPFGLLSQVSNGERSGFT